LSALCYASYSGEFQNLLSSGEGQLLDVFLRGRLWLLRREVSWSGWSPLPLRRPKRSIFSGQGPVQGPQEEVQGPCARATNPANRNGCKGHLDMCKGHKKRCKGLWCVQGPHLLSLYQNTNDKQYNLVQGPPLGTLLLGRKVYKSKVWVPESNGCTFWLSIWPVGKCKNFLLQIMYIHFHMSMSIRDVMTLKFRCDHGWTSQPCPHLKYSNNINQLAQWTG
jgi:hypothetical protein